MESNSSEPGAVVEFLRSHVGEWVTESCLAGQLGIELASLQAMAAELAQEGYKICVEPAKGWRFTGCEDRLIPREIQRELHTAVIGRSVAVLSSTASTNDEAWKQAGNGAAEGAVVLAEEQTAGRGRMGRSWQAPRGSGVLMSILLHPRLEIRQSHALTAMSSVAVAQSIREHLQVPARIRWPNDIFIGEHKVAGILVEGRPSSSGAQFVLGIGVNVNLGEEEFPPELQGIATSLSAATGHAVERVELVRWLLQSLDRWYRDLRSGDIGRIANHWRQLSSTLGRRVALLEDGHEFRGMVLDLCMEEGLIVRLDEGLTRIFRPATATLRHLPEAR